MDKPIFILGAAISDMMGFPFGKATLADSMPGRIARASGGVGRNLAENLVRLGQGVELITAFGGDQNGKTLLKECQELAIGIRHSILADNQPGAVHLAIMDEHKDLFAGIAELSVLDVISPAYLEQQSSALQEAKLICVETNTPALAINWLVQQEWDIPLYLDPVSTQLATRAKQHIGKFHTIKANRQQAEALTGRRLSNSKEVGSACLQLIEQGAKRVFITLGDNGAFAANATQQVHLPAAKVKVANTTGAGDAFHAGLIWASLRNWPLEDCCRAGLAASTIAVKSENATSAVLSEITLLDHIRKFC